MTKFFLILVINLAFQNIFAQSKCFQNFERTSSSIDKFKPFSEKKSYFLINKSSLEYEVYEEAIKNKIPYGEILLPSYEVEYRVSLERTKNWILKMLALKQREIGKLDKDEINYIELIIKELTQFASRINSDIKEKNYSLSNVYDLFYSQAWVFQLSQNMMGILEFNKNREYFVDFLIEIMNPDRKVEITNIAAQRLNRDAKWFSETHGFYHVMFSNFVPSSEIINRLNSVGALVASVPENVETGDGGGGYDSYRYLSHDHQTHFKIQIYGAQKFIKKAMGNWLQNLNPLKKEKLIRIWKEKRKEFANQILTSRSGSQSEVDHYLLEVAFFNLTHEKGLPAIPEVLNIYFQETRELYLTVAGIYDVSTNKLRLNHHKKLDSVEDLYSATENAVETLLKAAQY